MTQNDVTLLDDLQAVFDCKYCRTMFYNIHHENSETRCADHLYHTAARSFEEGAKDCGAGTSHDERVVSGGPAALHGGEYPRRSNSAGLATDFCLGRGPEWVERIRGGALFQDDKANRAVNLARTYRVRSEARWLLRDRVQPGAQALARAAVLPNRVASQSARQVVQPYVCRTGREIEAELVECYRESAMATTHPDAKQPRGKTLLAFAIIYCVWGSTFLAIRIGVQEVPPFLLAAMRFLVAGLLLYAWLVMRGERSPTAREWGSAFLLAGCIFVLDYGLVFWAEQRVPSGLTSVMLGTIPAFTALSEIIFLRTQKLTLRLAMALLIGLGGVVVLVSHSMFLGGAPIETAGAVGLIISAMSWSVASALMRKLPLPESKAMSSGSQMLAGSLLLGIIAVASGELRGFHFSAVSPAAWFALAYLIVFGSIIAFTAYVWLIHHEPPTKVGTYAYVNPVIAVLLGYFFAGEPLGLRTILGTVCVLISVIVITTTRAKKDARVPATSEEELAS